MKIKKIALLLLVLTMALAAAPAPASSAYCEGECNGAEILFGCPGTFSAAQCCIQAQRACGGSFNGVCSGDAELLCS